MRLVLCAVRSGTRNAVRTRNSGVAMKAQIKHILIQIVGWIFIVLGVLGLFLPILQGILFLLAGLIILSSEYAWAHKVLQKVRSRFPKLSQKADEASHKASLWMRRFSREHE